MAITLKSVSSPTTEGGTPAVPPREAITRAVTTRGPQAPQDLAPTARRRLVVGKSDKPIRPTRGGLALESVLDLDERTRIVSVSDMPWRLICALEIDAPWGTFVGTGWFAGPRTLITAGHCVYDRKQMGGWARSITVTPGRDRELKPFGEVVSTRFSTVDRWQSDQDPDFDIAAIHLDTAPFGPNEVFQVGSFPDDVLTDHLVNVSGYPAVPGGGQEQWWAKNRIRAVTPRRIFYDVDTSGGQSGGPAYIFQDPNGPPIVVGIHAYGEGGTPSSIPLRVNSAPRIIPAVVEQIEAWLQQDAPVATAGAAPPTTPPTA